MGRKSGTRELAVWVNGIRTGEWRIPTRGDEEFQYDTAWMESDEGRPLSLSLPFNLDNSPIKGEAIKNYFDNLLPDSEPIRQRLQKKFNTESRTAFDLLVAIGRDCVGAVQLLSPNEQPDDIKKINAQPLNDKEIETALIQTTSPTTLHAINDDFRISIAGAQEKSAFLFNQGRWCRPLGSTPTTHIFKLPLGLIGGIQLDMRKSVENEWLCSKIVSAYGITIAKSEMGTFGTQKALIVERFDRQLDSSGAYWLRLVQEDFCQVTALPATKKYEADGGPGILEIAEKLRGSENRDQDLMTFFKAQILFWMLAADDGHAKNFSIRILKQGRYQLTPLYDVISFWPIVGKGPNLLDPQTLKMAMSIRGKNKHYARDEIQRRHFNQTAARMGIGDSAEPVIEDLIKRTPEVVKNIQNQIPSGFPQDVLEKILSGLVKSAKKLEAMAH
jgi:serine/threonine-protein kinase HipA